MNERDEHIQYEQFDPEVHVVCGTQLRVDEDGAKFQKRYCPDGRQVAAAHLHVAASDPCSAMCPAVGSDHVHTVPEHNIGPEDVDRAIAADVRAGYRSIRGLYRKYRAYGVTKHGVRNRIMQFDVQERRTS